MLASACPKGRLLKWFSLHPEHYSVHREHRNQRMHQVVSYKRIERGKSLTLRPKKWSRSLTGGGQLLEVPTVRLWLGKVWCFGLAVAVGGGRFREMARLYLVLATNIIKVNIGQTLGKLLQKPRSYLILNLEAQTQSDTWAYNQYFPNRKYTNFLRRRGHGGKRGGGGSHVTQLNFKKSCVSISRYSLSCRSVDKNPLLLLEF